MNSHKIIRWGIIGCGAVTEQKSGPAYQKVAGFALHAVMRRNVSLAQDYAQRHGVPKFFGDAQALINDPEIDAIYIATPPDTHALYGVMVAESCKPCCIEKPLASSYDDSAKIVDAFQHTNTPLFVAYYRRSLPRFKKVKSLLEEGAIGKIRHISWHLSKPANPLDLSGEYNWRTDKKVAKGGYFDDLASHGLDLFAYLLGDYRKVSGFSHNQQGLYTSYDAVTAAWIHQGGVTGTGSWNFASHDRKDDVVIHGSDGELAFAVFDNRAITLSTSSHTERNFHIENPENIQLYHVKNMRSYFNVGEGALSTGKTALHTSWVMEEILKR